jgi:hypothetical protein
VNDLRERLDRLADAATEGLELTPPDQRQANRPIWRSRPALVAATAVVVIAAVTVAVLVGRDDGDDDVAVGGNDGGGSVGQGNDAVVAVTYGDASVSTDPVDLALRFLDADGAVIAERSWSEVEQPTEGAPGEAVVIGGLVQRVPAGELRLEASRGGTLLAVQCSQPFTAGAGDRLILRLEFGATCAEVQSVEDWVANRTGPTGVDYIGLTQAEADDRAQAAGLTTRVVAADGMDLAVTMDFRPDRLNLMLFDGVVVAAQLDGEQAVPADQGTLAVDLEPVEGMFIEGFDGTLQFYDSGDNLLSERAWSESVTSTGTTAAPGDIDPHYTHLLREPVPPGTVRLVTIMRIRLDPEGPRCETTVDVGEADVARVTLLFAPDERGACASVAAANAEADQLLGMPRGLPAPGFVGLSEVQAMDEAAARGWTVRVLARDGEGGARTDDYQPERVNLVLEDGRVVATARS